MTQSTGLPVCLRPVHMSPAAVKIKKPIQTKFRMPVLNWVALKPSQINGTVFNDIDDESILQVPEPELEIFESIELYSVWIHCF